MSKISDEQVSAAEKALIDAGKIIEAGWVGLRAMSIPADAPAVQIDEMRSAFFAGASHLFASIMRTLDPGEEPTEQDMVRLSMIQRELDAFIADYSARHMPTKGVA